MSDDATPTMDITENQQTYEAFIKGSIGLTLACAYILVALVGYGFGETGAGWVATLGMIFGFGACTYGMYAKGGAWGPSLVLLALMTLATVFLL